jgi:hypothetical protein
MAMFSRFLSGVAELFALGFDSGSLVCRPCSRGVAVARWPTLPTRNSGV